MQKTVCLILVCSLWTSSPMVFAEDDLNQYKEETEAIWRPGTGSQDGAFSAISTSMLGWGLGLGALIAIVASVLHQSTASSAHSHSHADTCP